MNALLIRKQRLLYIFLSFSTISLGIGIYIFFRDLNHLAFLKLLPELSQLKPVYISFEPLILSHIVMYNLPDMLWFISGILLLRFIWFYNEKIQKKYIICFYGIGVIFEISQLSENIPGTFDLFDLLFMCIGAFAESLLYKNFISRRCL